MGGFEECLYRPATDAETRLVLEGIAGGQPTVEVGSVVGLDDVPARLRAKGFSRHTFLCGQSGSGKTYATGVLLERLRLATTLPMIIFDPNSDHVHLAEIRGDAEADPSAATYRSMAGQVLVARARDRGGDHLLAVHFSELGLYAQARLLGLDPVADLDTYGALREVTSALASPYALADVVDAARAMGTEAGRSLALRIENLGVADWGVWCRAGDESLVEAAPLDQPAHPRSREPRAPG